MKYKVEKYIEKHQLMEKESPVLVALSGGADSVALLLVLHNHKQYILYLHILLLNLY